MLEANADPSHHDWRKRSCRDLWAEILGRLAFWKRGGGGWCSSWVKGHIDRTEVDASLWTGAQILNLEADQQATLATTPGWPRPSKPVRRARAVGGRWSGNCMGRGLGLTTWADDIEDSISRHCAEAAFQRYWKQRTEARGLSLSSAPFPCMDSRLFLSQLKIKRATTKLDFFKARLWWDHLPSPAVRARGSTSPPTVCDLCSQPGRCSTWHIIAVCGHPQLVEARHRGKEAIQEEIQSSIKDRIAHEPSYRRWTDAFSMTSNTWSTPEGWTDDTKAGQCFNHWYGLFHPDWLDGWYEEGDGSPEDWAAGVAALRRVSRASILACQGVWSTAGALWNNRISQDQNVISSSSVSARIAIMHSQAVKLKKTFLDDAAMQRNMGKASKWIQQTLSASHRHSRLSKSTRAWYSRWREWPPSGLVEEWLRTNPPPPNRRRRTIKTTTPSNIFSRDHRSAHPRPSPRVHTVSSVSPLPLPLIQSPITLYLVPRPKAKKTSHSEGDDSTT